MVFQSPKVQNDKQKKKERTSNEQTILLCKIIHLVILTKIIITTTWNTNPCNQKVVYENYSTSNQTVPILTVTLYDYINGTEPPFSSTSALTTPTPPPPPKQLKKRKKKMMIQGELGKHH